MSISQHRIDKFISTREEWKLTNGGQIIVSFFISNTDKKWVICVWGKDFGLEKEFEFKDRLEACLLYRKLVDYTPINMMKTWGMRPIGK
jgi:hypothetical protein